MIITTNENLNTTTIFYDPCRDYYVQRVISNASPKVNYRITKGMERNAITISHNSKENEALRDGIVEVMLALDGAEHAHKEAGITS